MSTRGPPFDTGPIPRLAVPHAAHPLERLVEAAAAPGERNAGGLVVVRAGARGDAQHEPPARKVVERGRLLCEQVGVHPERREQDVGGEPDPLGHGGRGGERHERLVVRIDQPVERAERGVPARVGALRPAGYLPPRDAGDRGRQADADLHVASSLGSLP
jgi:hypothetical protein